MRARVALVCGFGFLLSALWHPQQIDAAAVKSGTPDHFVARGGECVRLFHSKGSIGCRSLTKEDMDALFPVRDESQLRSFLKGENINANRKYTLVLPEEALQKVNLAQENVANIAGMLVFPDNKTNASLASVSPQGLSSPDAKYNVFAAKNISWNPSGNNFIDASFAFSVVLLQDNDIGQQFLKLADLNQQRTNNHFKPTYKAFMKYYFGPPEMDSIKCLQFKNVYGAWSPKCEPLGGQSAWGSRGKSLSDPSTEYVLAMAAMDSTAVSHILAPGANTAASGMVALLVAADALQAIPDSSFDKTLVFAAFQSERFGFVGSRRFLFDNKRFASDAKACAAKVTGSNSPHGAEFCSSPLLPSLEFSKLNMSRVRYAVAVDQVGVLPTNNNFSLFLNPNGEAKTTTTLKGAVLNAPSATSSSPVAPSHVTNALPPSSLLTFVNDQEFGRKDLAAAVIAGYDESFPTNGIYDSRHDVVGSLNVSAVGAAAQLLAETLYQLAAVNASKSKDEMNSIKVNQSLVEDMLNCLTTNWYCRLMKNYSRPYVNTMIKYLDYTDDSYPSRSNPVTFYTGTFGVTRQSLVMTDYNKNPGYSADYTKDWKNDKDRVQVFPNAYETFVRSFMASALSVPGKDDTPKSCTITQDCDTGYECVYPGVCKKQAAYFHDAFSPALKRTKNVGQYEIIDKDDSLWTEPVWDSDIGSYVFADPGNTIGWISLLVGLGVTAIGAFLSMFMLKSVKKLKLL